MTALRATVDGALGVSLAGLLLLGALWMRERSSPRETPRWDPAAFVPLRDAGTAGGPARGLTLVAVNPRCGRCLAALRRLHTRQAHDPDAGRATALAALIVDARERPGEAILRSLPPLPVWWDRDGVWRRRWGRRVYGERIEFDAAGRHVRTVAGEADPGDARTAAARGAHAPATRTRGGI